MTLAKALLAVDALIVSVTAISTADAVYYGNALSAAVSGILLGVWLTVAARNLGRFRRKRASA